MERQPKVSVVIPVYNREDLIARAIDSVLAQTYKDYEIIVVDDGSTDATRQRLERYGGRVRILHQRNRGPYAARNFALEHVRGEYVAFLDSDDVWHQARLERQVRLLDRSAAVALVYGDGNLMDEGAGRSLGTFFTRFNEPKRGRVFKELVRGNFIPQSSVLVRRKCFAETGPFWELPVSADYHKWLQIAFHHPIDYVDDVVFTYHLHGSNLVRDRISQNRTDIRIYQYFLDSIADPETAKVLLGRLIEKQFVLGFVFCREGPTQLLRTLTTARPQSSFLGRLGMLLRVLAGRTRNAIQNAVDR
jgi:glycosyltransferase involved in cell wall biosynthesis